jgi:hypothetical protein
MDSETPIQPRERQKRKSLTIKNDLDRVNRRRHQNRISQRCVREKQQAHKKQLEMFVEMIKSRNEMSKHGKESESALLDAHIAIIEENKRLKDALLQMRKKLLSLSSVASMAAGSRIPFRLCRHCLRWG